MYLLYYYIYLYAIVQMWNIYIRDWHHLKCDVTEEYCKKVLDEEQENSGTDDVGKEIFGDVS